MRPIVRKRILDKCKNRCVNCGSTETLEVDHIIPLSRGGKHNEDNFQILCKTCNLKKGRGVDYEKYFKIGESTEYIYLSNEFIEVLPHLVQGESEAIIKNMFTKNDELLRETSD